MRLFFIISLCILISINGFGQSPIYSSHSIYHPVIGQNGMVASQHPEATKVGIDILKSGGNAVDAAVAVGFTLAVVLPRAGNIGGGGFMLVHDAATQATKAINYREKAPAAARRDMFLDHEGSVDQDKYNQSYSSIGVPGTVAGLLYAHKKYGSLPLEDVIDPAINLAENGFSVTHDLARVLKTYTARLRKCDASATVFFHSDGHPFREGEILVQPDLAWSLRQIRAYGHDGFYKGPLADRMIRDIQSNGGIMTLKDLDNYEAIETNVVQGDYRSYKVISMPPPSSGGIHLIQMLNILEAFPLGYLGHNSAETIHLMAESMRLAYADRSKYLGDPEFWDVPVEGILSQAYADDLREKIDRNRANVSADIAPGNPHDYESEETTHFSVVDHHGNAVANTYTLNFSFGTGIMAKGTGILLNNEMGDFSAKPGTPDAFGLIGDESNAIQPGKRPLSSMTPAMVFKDGELYFITGSPGGSRIITAVLQVILNVIDHDMNTAEASFAPRIHHQWYPDILYVEPGISPDTRTLLTLMGHKINPRSAMGSTQSIMIKDGLLYGASDPRRPDALTIGY